MTKEELSLRGKICRLCEKTTDLAQCPECHFWFCREDDWHECFPEHEPHLQKQIEAALNRRGWALIMMLGGGMLAWWGAMVWLALKHIGFGVPLLFIAVALLVLSIIILRHYHNRLRQLGIRVRSIRPQTAKKVR